MSKLAIHGGQKVRKNLFPSYDPIGEEELAAVTRVVKTGVLSKYVGAWCDDFCGGPEVQALEQEWAHFFHTKHAIAVNSASSGLIAAVGAAGVGPGDEVIVTPYSMSISATAPLFYGAIPVFADVEPEYFCVDIESIKQNITSKTKAIIVVDLFGQPYNAEAVNALAKEHNLIVIEDAAQAPGVRYGDQYAGTLADIGVYSLNYHKHIHCGEGGIVVTNGDRFAERLQMIRNHAESVVGGREYTDLTNMLGFNFRMTEIEATIARVQLQKLPTLLEGRVRYATDVLDVIDDIPFLKGTAVRRGAEHAFYAQPILYDTEATPVPRDVFVDAVKAELMPFAKRESGGVVMSKGYVRPIYLLPLFQERILFGGTEYPFSLSDRTYAAGLCPVVERLHAETLFSHELFHPHMTPTDMEDVYMAFKKVAHHMDELI